MIRKTLWAAVTIFAVTLTLSNSNIVPGADPIPQRSSVLSRLQVGQHITLKEVGGNYDIRSLDDGKLPLGHQVIEVHDDFVVLKDITETIETRIPITSIRAVTHQELVRK